MLGAWKWILPALTVLGISWGTFGVDQTVVANQGGTTQLECDISYPRGVEYIIEWFKQGIQVAIFIKFNGYPPYVENTYKGRLSLMEDNEQHQATIEIQNVQRSDQGYYTCKVQYIDAEDKENVTRIFLQVNSVPKLGNVSRGLQYHKLGAVVTLFCEASGFPEPTVEWWKNGEKLTSLGRVTVDENEVQIKDLNRGDMGQYECVFRNVVGEARHEMKIIVEGEPYITIPPRNTTTREGNKVKLTCHAEAYPSNITYRWFKGNLDILNEMKDRAYVLSDGSLNIKQTIRSDTGWYGCRVTNGRGRDPIRSAFLNITYLPEVLPIDRYVHFPKGMSYVLRCPTDANPPVTRVDWTKDNKNVTQQTGRRVYIDSEWSLVFTEILETDAGDYKCTPYSSLGIGKTSIIIQVTVKDPPHFSLRPRLYYQRMKGDSVTFPCSAYGVPMPQITWKKVDGVLATKASTDASGNLTIPSVDKSDHGVYECIAKSVVTSIATSTRLIIEETTPHAPENVSVVTEQTTATVTWKPAYNGGHAQHYVVRFRTAGPASAKWFEIRVPDEEATMFTIYRLIPNTVYEFMVLSRNKLGDGWYSSTVKAKTKAGPSTTSTTSSTVLSSTTPTNRPGCCVNTLPTDGDGNVYYPTVSTRGELMPGTPTNVSITRNPDRQEGGYVLSWLAPKDSPAPVLYYKYETREKQEGNGNWQRVEKDNINYPKTSFVIKYLEPGKIHQFRVYSFTIDSYSWPSKHADIDLTGEVPPSYLLSGTYIAAIVGGIISLIALIIFIFVIFKCCRRRKTKDEKYGNVKYIGTNHVHSIPSKNEEKNAREDSNGFSGFSRMKPSHDGSNIFTLQSVTMGSDPSKDNVIAAEKWNRPRDKNIFDRNFSIYYDPDKVRKVQRPRGYGVQVEHYPEGIARTADGRFVPRGDQRKDYINVHHDVNDIIREPYVYYNPAVAPHGVDDHYGSQRLRTADDYEHLPDRDDHRPRDYRPPMGRPEFVRYPARTSHDFEPHLPVRYSRDFEPRGSFARSSRSFGSRELDRYHPTPRGIREQERYPGRSSDALPSRLPSESYSSHRPSDSSREFERYPPLSSVDHGKYPRIGGEYPRYPQQYTPTPPGKYRSQSTPPSGYQYDYLPSKSSLPDSVGKNRSRSVPPQGFRLSPRQVPIYDDRHLSQPHHNQFTPKYQGVHPYDRQYPQRPFHGQHSPRENVSRPLHPRGSRATESTASIEESFRSFDGSERDGVILRPGPTLPGMQRHSTMKPLRPDRTYFTSSPSEDLTVHPFNIDTDLSSVNPSSTATTDPSRRTVSSSGMPSSALIPSTTTLPTTSGSNIQSIPEESQQSYGPPPNVDPHFDDVSAIPYASAVDLPARYVRDRGEFQPMVVEMDEDLHRPNQYQDRENSPNRQVARVTPSPQRMPSPGDSGSEGSGGPPMTYTRDRLHGAIEKVRRGPLARRLQPSQRGHGDSDSLDSPHTPGQSYKSYQSTPSSSGITPSMDDDTFDQTVLQRHPQTYDVNVQPYKDVPNNRTSVTSGVSGSSGRGSSGHGSKAASLTQSHPDISQEPSQDPNISTSSGSRNTSQSTSNSSNRGRMNSSMSSTNTPQEHDISTESSPYSEGQSQHRRDISGDENYEFDSVNALESELLDALKNYSEVKKRSSRDYGDRDTDISHKKDQSPGKERSPYKRGEDRFAKLREEYQDFKRRQEAETSGEKEQWEEVESELL